MSFRPPSVRRRRPSNSPLKSTTSSQSQPATSSSPSLRLVEHHLLPRQRRAYGTSGLVTYRQEDLLVEPHNRSFTQPLFDTHPSIQRRPHLASNGDIPDDQFSVEPIPEAAGPLHVVFPDEFPSSSDSLTRKKKESQWAKWVNQVIPSMLDPYLRHLYVTESLRLPPQAGRDAPNSCLCHKETLLTVTCVYFHRT